MVQISMGSVLSPAMRKNVTGISSSDKVNDRSAEPTTVTVSWSGRRSDEDCSRSTAWALPGYYHVVAAVIGSEPNDAQFRLGSPPRPVVTKTAKPHKKKQQATQNVD